MTIFPTFKGDEYQRYARSILLIPVIPILAFESLRYRSSFAPRAHDYMDSFVGTYQSMSTAEFFSPPWIEVGGIFGGIPRGMIAGPLNLHALLSVILPANFAQMIFYVAGFLGAYFSVILVCKLHLSEHFWRVDSLVIINLTASAYAIHFNFPPLAFVHLLAPASIYILTGGTLSSQNVRRKTLWRERSVLLIFGLQLGLPVGLPIMVALCTASLLLFLTRGHQQLSRRMSPFVAGLCIGDAYLLFAFVTNDSHRKSILVTLSDFSQLPSLLISSGIQGDSYSPPFLSALGVWFSLLFIFVGVLSSRKWRLLHSFDSLAVLYVYAGVTLTPLLLNYPLSIASRIGLNLPLFQWDRAFWIIPGLQVLIVVESLGLWIARTSNRVASSPEQIFDRDGNRRWLPEKSTRYLVAISTSAMLFLPSIVSRLDLFGSAEAKAPTVNEYFQVADFQRLQNEIEYEGEVVGTIGMHPSTAIYNGFLSIDGYHPAYPKEHFEMLSRLIEPALTEDSDNRFTDYFLNWGSRGYLFQPSVGRIPADRRVVRDNIPVYLDWEVACSIDLNLLISTSPLTIGNQPGKVELEQASFVPRTTDQWTGGSDLYAYRVKCGP